MAAMQKVALVFGLLHLTSAYLQRPKITACSGRTSDVVTLRDVTLSNVRVGRTMILSYSMEVKRNLTRRAKMAFTITSGSKKLPCLNSVGSCTYRMCGSTKKADMQIGQPWKNKCPINIGKYRNSLKVPIAFLAWLYITDNKMHFKIEERSFLKRLGCIEFDVNVEKTK
ncbi:uncharacterized protein [Dermacentor albipictus]|uniref:uncharacterized protein n=1 Tax=Dermacentor albipictus TaxID=60249 RepID=UPI0038FC727F